jgi:ring-1,2-phenylacetyl-CoA epoxidase subunit PaaE
MSSLQFHPLRVRRVTPETAHAVVVTLSVPPEWRQRFAFRPGQFVTLRATVQGQPVRRSYSICSSPQRLAQDDEIDIGIKAVDGGVFSNWAARTLQPGDTLDVMPPDGRFTPRLAGDSNAPATRRTHRVAFAAGSGITPILSIIDSTLASDPNARFTLVYGNQHLSSVMFHERLQDLKDRYPTRLSLIHLLSRQAQEIALFNGRIDAAKVRELLDGLLPVQDIDEAFICGPEGMIDATEGALREAGLPAERIHTERFVSPDAPAPAAPRKPKPQAMTEGAQADIALEIVLDGKTHAMGMSADDHVLDAALSAGLDLPYSCKGGVCCTCRARVLDGKVSMDRNYTLEQWEVDKGFVLTCQSRPLTQRVVVSFDER